MGGWGEGSIPIDQPPEYWSKVGVKPLAKRSGCLPCICVSDDTYNTFFQKGSSMHAHQQLNNNNLWWQLISVLETAVKIIVTLNYTEYKFSNLWETQLIIRARSFLSRIYHSIGKLNALKVYTNTSVPHSHFELVPMQPSAHIFCTQSKVCLLPTPPYAQWIYTYVHITHLNTSTRPHVTSTSCSGSYV